MNHKQKIKPLERMPRQQTLDLSDPQQWRQLPDADQQACRDALAQLVYQMISQQPGDQQDER
jgi:hypothetical protein